MKRAGAVCWFLIGGEVYVPRIAVVQRPACPAGLADAEAVSLGLRTHIFAYFSGVRLSRARASDLRTGSSIGFGLLGLSAARPGNRVGGKCRCPPHRRPFRLEQDGCELRPCTHGGSTIINRLAPGRGSCWGRVGRRCACETGVSDRDRGNAGIKLSVDFLRLLLLYKKRRRAMNPPSLELSHKKDTSHCGKCPPVMRLSCCMCRLCGVFCAGWGDDVRWLMSQRDAPASR